MTYFFHLLVLIGIYLPLVYSLNLTLGFSGLLCFCHAAFFGIGAYGYARLVTVAGLQPAFALPLCVLITGFVAAGIGAIALRFRGDLFLFVTLAFQMIVYSLFYNWVWLTAGPYGISGIPRPDIFGMELRSPAHFALLALAMNGVLLPFLFSLYRSPFGLTLKALRENETAAESLGVRPGRIYLQAFVVAAMTAAVPGAVYAGYVTYIDPTSFTLNESIFLVAILLIGGAGNRIGPFLGLLVMLLLPEALRFVGLPDAFVHNAREIIYGLLLVVIMYARPQGLTGEFKMSQS